MNNLQKLYQSIFEAGLINNSFDDFSNAMLGEDYQKKVFKTITDRGLFDQDFNTFKSAYVPKQEQEFEGSGWDSFKASLGNAFEMSGDVLEFWGGTLDGKTSEEVLEDNDVGAFSGLSIVTTLAWEKVLGRERMKELKKENPNFFATFNPSDSDAFQKMIQAFDTEKKEQKRTMTFAEADGIGDYLGVISGAIANVGGSVAYNLGTLGTGFFMEFAADNVITANEAKAKSKGLTLDELAKSGQLDTNAAFKIAAVQAGLEYVGFSRITKPLKGTGAVKKLNKAVGKFLGEKYAKSKSVRIGLDIIGTGRTEAFTEMGQTGLEIYNKELAESKAKGENINDLLSITKGMFSPEGIEAGLQGFFGGGGLKGGGYSAKALNTIRQTDQTLDVEQELNDLTKLNQAFNAAVDDDVKSSLQDQITKVENKLKAKIKKGNDKYSLLTDDEISNIENLTDLANTAATRADALVQKLNNKEITREEFNLSIGALNETYKQSKNDIKEILFQKDLKFAKEEGARIGKEVKVVKSKEEFQQKYNELRAEDDFDGDVTDRDGFIIGDEIYINELTAREEGAISVGSHELLHGIIQKSFSSLSPKQRSKLSKGFYNSLNSEQKSYVEGRLKESYGEEINDKFFENEKAEELFTLFSDGIALEKISFNETLFQKIGLSVEQFFQNYIPGYKKTFGNGRQAYQFLKEYNENRKAGKLGEAAVKLAAEGKATATTTKASLTKISDRAKKISGDVDAIGKKAKNKAEYDAGINIEAYNYLIEGDGLTGLIKARLAKQGIDTEGPDANVNDQPIANYIEDVKAKLIPDVLGFNPEAETTEEGKFGLSGYINQRLGYRMGDVSKVAKKTPTGRSLDAPIDDSGRTAAEAVEGDTDAQIEALEEQDLSVNAENRSQETEQDKNELKSRYRHKLKNNDGSKLIGETQVESVREGVRTTLRRLKDNVTSDKFLLNFENMVKKTMKNIVQKSIGSGVSYRQFVLNNFEAIVDFSTVQDLVAMERLVGKGKLKDGKKIFTVPIKRLTKQEDIQKAIDQGKLPPDAINKSAEGVFLSEKRMPTRQELEAFFFGVNMQEVLGYELGASTLGTRKDGLSRMIVTELSQDAMMETMQEPDIMEELLEAQPEVAKDVMVNSVATKINRAPSLKFSFTKTQQTDAKKGFDILYGQKSGDGFYGQNFQNFINDENIDGKVKSHVIDDYVKRNAEAFNREDLGITQDELDALDYTKTGKKRRKKIATYKKYEIIARKRLQNIFDKSNLGYKVQKLSEKDNNPDLVITRNGKVALAIEIKGNTARGISVSFNYKQGQNKLVKTKDKKETDNYLQKEDAVIGKASKLFDKMINKVKKKFGNDAIQYTKFGNLQFSKEAVDYIKEEGLHLEIYNNVEFITTEDVAYSYQQKQGKDGTPKPSHIIDIGSAGMFNMSTDSEVTLEGLNNFADQKAPIPIMARVGFNLNTAKTHYTISVRLEPQLNSIFFEKQNVSLLNKDRNKNVKIKSSKSTKLNVAQDITKASDQARTTAYFSKTKGASIFDFDETVGISENVIIATKEGVTKEIPSDQWPFVGEDLANQGYEFDFTDFNKVTKGKPGPLLPKMKNQIKKYGSDNVFILTARAPESAEAIHAWLKSEGVNIPLENITGLGNSTGEAKAMWVLDKYANEGYNDMYFVDDAITNVQAVQNIFDQLDIKGKSVQAKMKFSNTKKQSFDDVLKRRSIEVQSATISSINNTIDANVNLDTYSQIKFSKTHRDAYEARLTKKRTDLDEKQIKGAVESVFKFVEGENIPKNKKSKFEKLAFHYMANGYLILPEDGYKVIEAERIATIKKIDPFSYKNPNELIEKFVGEVKGARTNPDTVKEFTNKTDVGQGVTVYDVEYSKEGQIAVRKVIDTHFGKKANPWCLAARQGEYYGSDQAYSEQERDQIIAEQEAVGRSVQVTEYKEDGQTVYELTVTTKPDPNDMLKESFANWKNYNKEGNGYKIAFKNGKLLCFRDGNKKQWWDRNDKPSDKIHFIVTEKKGDVESTFSVVPEDGTKTLTKRIKGKMPNAEVFYVSDDNNYNIKSNTTYVNGAITKQKIETTFKDSRLAATIFLEKQMGQLDDFQLSNITKDVEVRDGNILTRELEGKVVLTSKQFKEFEDKTVEIEHVTNTQTSETISLTINGIKQDIGVKFSRTKKQSFDSILKRSLGIDQDIDPARAKIIGAKKGKREFFIAPGADDFQGLMMRLAGKGEQGESDMKFFKQVFFDPFNRAYRKLNSIQYNMMESYAQIRKEHKDVIKKLKKKLDNEFTNEDAIRIYLWDLQDLDVPGLTTTERKAIASKVASDADMVQYALKVRKSLQIEGDQYLAPTDTWTASSIKGDMYNSLNKVHRDGALEEWQENINELLDNEAQMAKLEAAMGADYVESLKDMLYRMRTGKNRPSGQNASTNKALNWLQGSVGAIMFFNMRSAVLQTISTVNFINHTDNNIFAFSKAIANVPQFAKDFKMLFNSPQLKVRRSGLQQDIQTADLADSLSRGGGAANALAYLLKIGFTPTQVADSFAIAFGGATFYRNRVKSLMKQGMTQDQAESQAMIDFQDITEESQQSSRPDRISKQQASPVGRLLLAFQNTPLQYNRIIKKAVTNIANKRGNIRDHLSRIAYYGAVQSLIFYSLQQALFAEDEPEEDQVPSSVKKQYKAGIKDGSINRFQYPSVSFYYADVKNKQKKESLANSMADGWLRGSGVKGAMVSTFKNVVKSFMKESDKGYKADYFNTFVEVLNLSPQIGSKARKIKRATDTYKYNKDVMAEIGAFDIDNPVYPMTTSLIEGTTNAPVHRIYTKLDNLKEAFNEDNTAMQRTFVALGWNQWQMGIDTYKDVREAKEKIKEEKKAKKKQCRRILKNGKRCSIRTTNKSQLCYHHD